MGFQRDQPVDDFVRYRQLEMHIQHTARRLGLDGSPLADVRNEELTLGQRHASIHLYLELPADMRRLPGCKDMCDRLAGSSSYAAPQGKRPDANDPHRPPPNRPSNEHPGQPANQRQGRNYGRRHER